MATRLNQGAEPAIAAAYDADALRVRKALLHGPCDSIGEIVLHRLPPLLPAGAEMPETVTGAAAVLGLNDQVTPRGEKLRLRVPFQAMPAHERPAMDQYDCRQRLSLLRRRGSRQINRKRQAVAGGYAVEAARALRGFLEPRPSGPEPLHLQSLPAEQEALPGLPTGTGR